MGLILQPATTKLSKDAGKYDITIVPANIVMDQWTMAQFKTSH